MRRSLAALLLAGALAALAPAPAGAIVGGRPASQPYPFMVQLQLKEGEEPFSFACGASVVRPGWVLTAAHCVADYPKERIRLYAGRTRLSENGGEELPVAEVIVSPGYRESDGRTHDVALLRLARPAKAPPVRIVGLGERPVWAPGVRATVIGWGATSFGGDVSDQLLEVDVPIQSDDACETALAATAGYDRATNFCAGELLGGGDSCQGDSGGPILAPDGSGRLVLVGTVSFGFGCAYPTQYGVYARVGDRELNDWLAARLPAEGAAPAPPPAAPSEPGSEEPGTRSEPVIAFSRRLRAGRRIRVRVRTAVALRRVTVTVRRGRRTVARGTRSRLARRATLRLRPRGRPRPGRVTVTIRGRTGGETITARGRARLVR